MFWTVEILSHFSFGLGHLFTLNLACPILTFPFHQTLKFFKKRYLAAPGLLVVAWGGLVPDQGWNPGSLHWELES